MISRLSRALLFFSRSPPEKHNSGIMCRIIKGYKPKCWNVFNLSRNWERLWASPFLHDHPCTLHVFVVTNARTRAFQNAFERSNSSTPRIYCLQSKSRLYKPDLVTCLLRTARKYEHITRWQGGKFVSLAWIWTSLLCYRELRVGEIEQSNTTHAKKKHKVISTIIKY